MTSVHAVVLGASGYGGGELLRLLSAHPAVSAIGGTSRQFAGRPFGLCHPNLNGIVVGRFEAEADWSALSMVAHPVVFSAMPNGELASHLPALEQHWARHGLSDRLTLIDLSGDFRLDDAAVFEAAYGTRHPCPERLGTFTYGLPEWTRDRLSVARRIAAAGCFATALQIGLLPLVGLDLGLIAASGVTGSSGSGLTPSATTHHPTRANDFRAYKALHHQHMPEVEATLARARIGASMAFVPHSAPLVRGIFATLQFALPPGVDGAELGARAAAAFAGEPFLRLVEGSPRVAAVVGSNFCDISVTASRRHGAVLVALDNLVKGMSGQAIQCMNVALGLPETTGLRFAGAFPA